MGKRKRTTENIISNLFGEEIHVFDGPNGPARIKKLNMAARMLTGDQYCPYCHIKTIHKDSYYECEKCNYSITDEEAEDGDGFPTEEASYESDFGF